MDSLSTPENEAPRDFPESPICKRCSNLITTGHAYELGGNRWHTHCFSCYKCDKPLSCDSEFLVLGTSALICFECSDSCKSCGKKIDDLAIILASSNEAYCSDCFKCCKCTEKINDLRYAKTKKGLFCISCHERLLAKKKYHDEKKRRLKKELPSVPSNDQLSSGIEETLDIINLTPEYSQYSLTQLPGKSSLRDAAKDLTIPKDMEFTMPVDFSKGASIKSNSTNVVAQFLEDGNIRDSNSVLSESDKKSSSNLDKMLQDTLNNSEDDDTLRVIPSNFSTNDFSGDISSIGSTEHMNLSPRIYERKTTMEKELSSSALWSPVMNNRSAGADDEHEEKINKDSTSVADNILSTPKSKPFNESNIRTPSSARDAIEYQLKGLGLSPQAIVKSKSNDRSITNLQVLDNSHADDSFDDLPMNGQNKQRITNVMDTPLNTSDSNYHSRTSSGGKSLSRSLSIKSKNIISNLRMKSKLTPSPSRPERNPDTHSGWGVQNDKNKNDVKRTSYQGRKRISSRGQSDSSILPSIQSPTNDYSTSHIRSQSGSSKISMFSTPPVLSINSLENGNSVNIENKIHPQMMENQIVEEEEPTSSKMESLDRDVKLMSLQLRKLYIEVKELNQTKSQLQKDIKNLINEKERLLSNIDQLQHTQKEMKSSATSQESLTEEQSSLDVSPVKTQQNTASSDGTAKPRFWKIFGGSNVSMRQESNNQRKNLEISAPVLQNPNEFNDLKLLPIKNKAINESEYQDSNIPSENGEALFEASLVARCAFEQRDVPLLVEACISYIESDSEFLESEGLYRKSGSKTMIEKIESQFQSGIDFTLQLEHADVNAVTSVLKRYLRRLPNPVFAYELYDSLIQLVRSYNLLHELPLNQPLHQSTIYPQILDDLSDILRGLPNEHLAILRLLCVHLERVRDYQNMNLMNLHNLALVFAPGLVKDEKGEKDIIDMKERNYLVGFVFQNYKDIFARL